MEERPGGRRVIGQFSRMLRCEPAPGKHLRCLPGQRLCRIGRAIKNRNGNRREECLPVFPLRELDQIVSTHDPDESFFGKTGLNSAHAVDGEPGV